MHRMRRGTLICVARLPFFPMAFYLILIWIIEAPTPYANGGRHRPLMKDTEFSTEGRCSSEPRYFEDLTLGEKFYIPSKTMTAAHFAAFQMVSGDNHPLHYDVEYCKARGHRNLLAHGFQVVCQTAAGAGIFPHVIGDALVGMTEQWSRFIRPVYEGDTLYPLLTVSKLTPQRTTGVVTLRATVHNQEGELCLEGEQSYLVKRRNPQR